jgi:hypothetical protein
VYPVCVTSFSGSFIVFIASSVFSNIYLHYREHKIVHN